MAAINHNASLFLTAVARQFDKRHFPREETLLVFKENGNLFSEPTYMTELPIDVQTEIQDKANNFAHWLKLTNYLGAPLKDAEDERKRKIAIERSAKNLLERLYKPLGYVNSYSEQLLTCVFQDAFNRVKDDKRPDQRKDIIDLAVTVQPFLENLPYTFRRVKYKAEIVVAGILNHTGGKILLTYLSYRVGRWAQPQIYNLFSQTVIPRAVNYLINNTHITIIRVVSGAVALVQYAYYHYIKASITFYVAKCVTKKAPPLQRVVIIVENFAFFPGRVIGWVMMGPIKLMTSSWKMQSSLAANLNANISKNEAKKLEEGAMIAHGVWMVLMQEGIKTTLISSQPKKVQAE